MLSPKPPYSLENSPKNNDIPAIFANPKRKPRFALVRGLTEGNFVDRYLRGAQAMATELGVELLVWDAQGRAEKMNKLVEQAASQDIDALIIDHAQGEKLQASIEKALAKGVRVVAFDMVVDLAEVPEIEQDDLMISFLLSRKIVADYAGKAEIIYINADGFAPLEKRDRIWQVLKWRFAGLKELAHIGDVTAQTDEDTEAKVTAILKEYPQANVIVAMWDEFAKGAVRAVTKAGRSDQVCVYSVDVTDLDIRMMTEPGSPWKATVATDSLNIGRLAVRTAAALVAGERVDKYISVSPTLFAQEFLKERQIGGMDELVKQLSSLGESSLMWFDWMQRILELNGYRRPMLLLTPEQLIERLTHALESSERRNTQLQTVSEIARAIGSVHDLEEMIQQLVEMAQDRFGLYYVGMFFKIGKLEPRANLVAGSGEAGQAMVKENFGVKLDDASPVGECILSGKPHLAREGDAISQFNNELLPHTRSELILPLIGRDQVFGALSLQSSQAAAFEPDELVIYESLANHVAAAIENLRLLSRTQETVRELQAVQRRYAQEAWSKK